MSELSNRPIPDPTHVWGPNRGPKPVTSYPVWLSTMSAWMSMQHVAGLCQKVAEVFDSLFGRTRFAHHFCAVLNCILQPKRYAYISNQCKKLFSLFTY